MPPTAAFYSINEAIKPALKRVHHNNSACPPGLIYRKMNGGLETVATDFATTVPS